MTIFKNKQSMFGEGGNNNPKVKNAGFAGLDSLEKPDASEVISSADKTIRKQKTANEKAITAAAVKREQARKAAMKKLLNSCTCW